MILNSSQNYLTLLLSQLNSIKFHQQASTAKNLCAFLFLSNVQGEWKLQSKTAPHKTVKLIGKLFTFALRKKINKKMLGTGLKSFPYLGIKGYLSSTSFHLGFTFHPIANACQVYERSVSTLKQRQWLDLRPH